MPPFTPPDYPEEASPATTEERDFATWLDGQGNVWCNAGYVAAQTGTSLPSGTLGEPVFLEVAEACKVAVRIQTDEYGEPTTVHPPAAFETWPTNTNHRPPLTTGPTDEGQTGDYYFRVGEVVATTVTDPEDEEATVTAYEARIFHTGPIFWRAQSARPEWILDTASGAVGVGTPYTVAVAEIDTITITNGVITGVTLLAT